MHQLQRVLMFFGRAAAVCRGCKEQLRHAHKGKLHGEVEADGGEDCHADDHGDEAHLKQT